MQLSGALYTVEGLEHGILRIPLLRIPRGVTVILGPNGSGKTTLLRLLARADRPRRGRISGPRRVGSAWRNPYLSFHKATVLEELSSLVGEERALGLLEEYGLLEARSRSPFTLSVGQARILSLLLASSWGPEALVLDEPTTGLSPRRRAWLSLWLRDLGIPVVVATHEVETALLAGDHAILLSRGRPVLEGPIESVIWEAADRLGYPRTGMLELAKRRGVEWCRLRVRGLIQRAGLGSR